MAKTPASLLIKNVRDSVVAMLGAGAFAFEILVPESPRAIIIWSALLMLGLPIGAITDRLLKIAPDLSQSGPASSPPPSEDATP